MVRLEAKGQARVDVASSAWVGSTHPLDNSLIGRAASASALSVAETLLHTKAIE